MSDQLAVVLYGRQIGTVERRRGTLSFRYDRAYAASPEATPLSASMPLNARSHPQPATEAYLRGLLPDNPLVVARWASDAGVSSTDTFGLIRAVGLDCPGAAVFVPPEHMDQALSDHGDIEPVSDAQIGARLRALRSDESDWRQEGEHWSLAGAQAKFTLARTPDGWGIPRGMAPSTHIIKPGITGLPAQALTEHVSLHALRSCGISAARSDFVAFAGQPAIVVERYDRVTRADATVVRVHQEDMCQALAVLPEQKYQSAGGPGAVDIVRMLTSTATRDDAWRFTDGLIANVLLAAPDAHAKNYSVLLTGPRARLAPLYDVASGAMLQVRGDHLKYPKAAMSIGGEYRFEYVAERHWVRFATDAGLDPDRVVSRVSELAAMLPDAISDVVGSLPADTIGLREVVRMPSEVDHLARRVRRQAQSVAGATGDQPRDLRGRYGFKPNNEQPGGAGC